MSDIGNKYLNIEVPPQEYDPVEAQSFRYTIQQNFRTVRFTRFLAGHKQPLAR